MYLPRRGAAPGTSECEVAGSDAGFPREGVGGGAHGAESFFFSVGVRRHASVRWKFRFGLLPAACRLPRRGRGRLGPDSGLWIAFSFFVCDFDFTRAGSVLCLLPKSFAK